MDKKVIIFGPWVGEFSYELSWWIPEIRKVRNTYYKDFNCIAVSSKGREILYSDFVDGFIYYPDDLESQRKYPATYGEHDPLNGRDIIPKNFQVFIDEIVKHYQDRYEVYNYQPGQMPIDSSRVFSDNPYGEFINYTSSANVTDEIIKKIKFDNDKDTISILARLKNRENRIDGENWNPKSWSKFIQKLIVELDLNIILTTIRNEKSKGGTLDFSKYDFYKQYNDRIKEVVIDGETSVEKQIAVLENTTCSIWGGTGAVTLAFFANTPVFTQQTTDNGSRLNFEWQKRLTNNHENVEIFIKYKYGKEFYDSPVQEMVDRFSDYYNKLRKKQNEKS